MAEWLHPPVGVAGEPGPGGRCHPPEEGTPAEAADLEAQRLWEETMEPGGHE